MDDNPIYLIFLLFLFYSISYSHLGGSFPHQHAFAAYAKRLETVAVNGGSAGATVARIGRRQRSLQARQTSRLRRSRRLRSLHPRQILKTKHNKTKQKQTYPYNSSNIYKRERETEREKENQPDSRKTSYHFRCSSVSFILTHLLLLTNRLDSDVLFFQIHTSYDVG